MFEAWAKLLIEILFGLGLFFNAVLFIPQAIILYKKKDSKELSLITFTGFNFIQLFSVLHGYLVKDYILMFGFLFSLITGGIVTIMIILYRKNY